MAFGLCGGMSAEAEGICGAELAVASGRCGTDHACAIAPGMKLDLAIEPKINEWNGTRSVEVELRDMRVCE